MLNEEKVILMTKMASYEENEGKKNENIGNYFRGDYVALQVVKSVICSTLTFVLIVALYIFYDFEEFMQDIYKIDLFSYVRSLLIYYVITVIIYGAFTYLISTLRYFKAVNSLKTFSLNLKKLNSIFREHKN